MSTAPDGRALVGSVVRLDVISPDDGPALFAALDDPRVWAAGYAGGPGARPGDPAGMQQFVESALAAYQVGQRVPYVVRLASASVLGSAGTVVGTTSLGDVDLANERAHLGWTAYGTRW